MQSERRDKLIRKRRKQNRIKNILRTINRAPELITGNLSVACDQINAKCTLTPDCSCSRLDVSHQGVVESSQQSIASENSDGSYLCPENDVPSQTGKKKCPHCQRIVSITARGLARFHKYEGARCFGTSQDLSDLPFAHVSSLQPPQPSFLNETLKDCAVCGRASSRKRTMSCIKCNRVFHLTCIKMNRRQAYLLPIWECRTCAGFSAYNAPSSHHEPTRQSNDASELLQSIWFSNVRTIVRLPWNCRREAADLFSSLIKSALVTNSLDSWIHLLGLPKLCFSVPNLVSESRGNHHKSRIIRAQIRNYQSYPINIVTPQVRKPAGPRAGKTFGNVRAATILARKGNYRKAMQRLTSTGIVAPCPKTKLMLIALHPGSDRIYSGTSAITNNHLRPINQELSDHPDFNPPSSFAPIARFHNDSASTISVDPLTVTKAIKSFAPGSSGGCFDLRPEHLQDLLTADTGGILLERLTCFVNYMLSGLAPRSLAPFFAGANLIALPKKDSNIRPIAVGEVLRRLVSKCVCVRLRTVFRDILSPTQYGVAIEDGVVRIIHRVRALHKIHNMSDSWVWAKIDLSNAFNSVHRSSIFSEVSLRIPELLPWTLFCYQNPTYLRISDSDHIFSAEGVQQGDPLGPFLFSLAIHQFVTGINSIPGIACNMWYLDDGIIGGEPEAVCTALNMIDEQFKTIGLLLNWGKTEVIGSPVATAAFSLNCRHLPTFNPTGDFELLGTPLGSVQFIRRTLLDTYLPKLKADMDSVSAMEDSQIAFLLLSKCCSMPRVTHLMRTVDPRILQPFATRFDAYVLDSLQNIIASQLNPNQRDQAALPAKLGGLGLRRASDHSIPFFVSCIARVARVEGFPCSYFPSFDSCCSDLLPAYNIPTSDGVLLHESRLSSIVDNTTHKSMLDRLNQFDRARCLAVAQPHASAWLHVIPSEASRSAFPPSQFCALVRLWLGIPLTPSSYRCSRCYRHGDRYGLHALTCQFGGFGGVRHDAIRDVFFRAAQRARMHVGLETRHLLPDLQERPADILLYRDPPEAVDFAVTNPLQPAYVARAATIGGSAAHAYAEGVKCRKYKLRVESAGYSFTPAVVESFGGWNDRGEALIRQIATFESRVVGTPYSIAATRIFQEASVALMRGNARAILASLDDTEKIRVTTPVVSPPEPHMFSDNDDPSFEDSRFYDQEGASLITGSHHSIKQVSQSVHFDRELGDDYLGIWRRDDAQQQEQLWYNQGELERGNIAQQHGQGEEMSEAYKERINVGRLEDEEGEPCSRAIFDNDPIRKEIDVCPGSTGVQLSSEAITGGTAQYRPLSDNEELRQVRRSRQISTYVGEGFGFNDEDGGAAFIRVVGSELDQKYLGKGPRMVRDVFRLAKENSPAIVFIDENDAIATRRFDAQTGGDREVQRILLELLNQMDGFDQTVNDKVIMATNRADTLDPALLRPGRLDRKIELPLSDRRQKRLVFTTVTSQMNLSDDVDLEDLISRPDRISGADISAICQEAGMQAVRDNRYIVLAKDFDTGYKIVIEKTGLDHEFLPINTLLY